MQKTCCRRIRQLARQLAAAEAQDETDAEALALEAKISSTDLAVEVSNRHIHVTEQDVEDLFGKGYELKPVRGLVGFPLEFSHLAGFAAAETLDVVNPVSGKRIENVRILGPPRPATQIELSYTDCRALKIEAPTRISGDVKRSGACQLVAKNGNTLDVKEGVIRAWRHVHLTNTQADRLGVKSGDLMAVKVVSPMNSMTMHDVMVRVYPPPKMLLEMWQILADLDVELPMEVHLDTDEGNASMIQDATMLELYKIDPNTKAPTLVAHSVVETGHTEWAAEQAKRIAKRAQALEYEGEPREGGVYYDREAGIVTGTPAAPPMGGGDDKGA